MKKTTFAIFTFISLVSVGLAQDQHNAEPLDLSRFLKAAAIETADSVEIPEPAPKAPVKVSKYVDSKGSTEVSLDYSRQYLTNGRGIWDEATLGVIHKFSTRKVLYASYAETERFDRRDRQAMIGFYQPLDEKWTLLLEGSASPTHRVLPKWSAMAQVERSFGNGWIGKAGYRRTELDAAKVNIVKLGVEKYWGLNRAEYSLSINNLENTGTSPSQRIQYSRYYGGETSSVGVSFAIGREVENTGPNSVLQSDIYNITVNGKHSFSRRWALAYGFTHHKQGDIYSRRGITFGLRYKF